MKKTFLILGLAVVSSTAFSQAFSEAFDAIGGVTSNGQLAGGTLEAGGWYFNNLSQTRGLTDWFQGNLTVFPPQASAGYLGTNFNNTTNADTISNWALLPVRTLKNGDQLKFWTRSVELTAWGDRLQVRMSLAGASNNCGTNHLTVGDFTTLLLDINPTYLTGAVYPETWTEYTVTVSGLAAPTSGRFAFRYFVESGGPLGANSNYIGIDEVSYIPAAAETNVSASSYTVLQGLNFGGNLASLQDSDNNRVIVLCDELNSNSEIQFDATLPAGTVSQLKFKYEGSATRSDLSQFVAMYNWSTSAYAAPNFQSSTLADSVVNLTVSANVANYYNGSRQVRSRVLLIPQADIDSGDGWTTSTDQVQWTMVP